MASFTVSPTMFEASELGQPIDEINNDACVVVEEVEKLDGLEELADDIFCTNEDIAQGDMLENNNVNQDVNKGKPHIGMQFPSDDAAFGFYNDYAKRMGFTIRKDSAKRPKPDKPINRRYLVCYKAAYKRKPESVRAKKRVRQNEEGCQARMTIHMKDGAWIIKQFYDEHNHEMFSFPSKARKLPSHNKQHLQSCVRKLMEQFSKARCGPSRIARLLNATGDGTSNITPEQCQHYLRKKRKNNIGRECITVIQQFLNMTALDHRFYHSIELDEDGVCRSIFWVDGRARKMYENFGDVVVFDVTYKTNQFLLPFAPFTGVNHHGQSTLFGYALLADEQEETFVWLFEQWLNCMGGKAPGAIITDQDPAIINAIKRVFPNTRHRFCIWHISLHEDEHLRSLRSSYNPDFDKHYYRWVKSKTIEEAEIAWIMLKEKYKREYEEPSIEKQRNEMKSWRWLESMYEKRHNWVDVYLKDTFFAGMRSSQRSESINAFFDGYVNSMTPLHEFVDQYSKAVQCRRDEEDNEDLRTMRTKPNFKGMHPLEVHVGKVYTRKIFTKFQLEFKEASFHCWHDEVNNINGVATYNVFYEVDDKVDSGTVQCSSQRQFNCSCGKFETTGLLCKHILYVMKQCCQLKSIPEQYILDRWTLAHRNRSE